MQNLSTEHPLQAKLENIMTAQKFGIWLSTKFPMDALGERMAAGKCPLSNYIREKLGLVGRWEYNVLTAQKDTSIYLHGAEVADIDTPLWAKMFMYAIDYGLSGTPTIAKEAWEAWRMAKQWCKTYGNVDDIPLEKVSVK